MANICVLADCSGEAVAPSASSLAATPTLTGSDKAHFTRSRGCVAERSTG